MVAVTVGEGRRAPPPWLDRAERRIFAADTWAAERRTFAQMSQFWRCLTNQMMTHHPVGRAVCGSSLFRGHELLLPEQARRRVVGRPGHVSGMIMSSTQNQSDGPVAAHVINLSAQRPNAPLRSSPRHATADRSYTARLSALSAARVEAYRSSMLGGS